MRMRPIALTPAIATLMLATFLLASPAAFCDARKLQAAPASPLTVFAAASLAPALTEIAAGREEPGGFEVRLVFASSGVLARQIASGAPADLFISANRRWMDWLVARGLTDGTPVPLLGNRLVLVQPAGAREMLALDNTLPARLGDGRFAIGDPAHVPAGIYAKEALESLGLWSGIEGAAVFLPNVRAALLLVERGEAAAGIVYASDAALSKKIRIAAAIPADSHAPIIYPAGIIAAGDTVAARRFVQHLQRAEALAVFRRHGFIVD